MLATDSATLVYDSTKVWNGSACVTPTSAGSLSLAPTSCVIASGASTCSTVYATWTTSNTTAPTLVDGNTGTTLSTAANQTAPGLQVWVAYPQTAFNLKDGSTLLDTKTATASCTSGSTWNGSVCVLPPLSVSCVGTPGNPYVNQPVSWTSTVTGGTSPYTYVWTDPNNSSFIDTNSSTQTTYTKTGPEAMSLQVTDSSGKTASATCTAGVNQPNGPSSAGSGAGGSGGSGVSAGACTASLSASPTTVDAGGSTSLSWSVSGGGLCASTCTSGTFTTGGSASGSGSGLVPSSASGTYSFDLTCSGGTYSSSSSPAPILTPVTVTNPTAGITINGQTGTARVNQGTAIIVAWTGANAASCAVTKDGTPWKATLIADANRNIADSASDTATTKTTYTVICKNRYGASSASASATVNILAVFNQF